jgi:hypothetical protein
LADVTLSAEGLQLMMKASANTRRRLKNCFLGKLGPRIPQVPAAGHLDWLEQALEGPVVMPAVAAGAVGAGAVGAGLLGALPAVAVAAASPLAVAPLPSGAPMCQPELGQLDVEAERRHAGHRRRAATVTANATAFQARRVAAAAAAAAAHADEDEDDDGAEEEKCGRGEEDEERGIERRGDLRVGLED